MSNVLVLYAHPAPHKSRINRRLTEAAKSVAGVTVRDLYEQYPDFLIDVTEEQRLLLEHDVIVFQHPFYWGKSSAPKQKKAEPLCPAPCRSLQAHATRRGR